MNGTKYILSALSRLPGFKKNTGKSEGQGCGDMRGVGPEGGGSEMDFIKAILHVYKIFKQPLKGKKINKCKTFGIESLSSNCDCY